MRTRLDAARPLAMRAAGNEWNAIAEACGFASAGAVYKAVGRYCREHGLAVPSVGVDYSARMRRSWETRRAAA